MYVGPSLDSYLERIPFGYKDDRTGVSETERSHGIELNRFICPVPVSIAVRFLNALQDTWT